MQSEMMPVLALKSRLSHWERSDRPCDLGEGLWHIDRPYPLTPALSPWERGLTEP
jgi:hypothetical protein